MESIEKQKKSIDPFELVSVHEVELKEVDVYPTQWAPPTPASAYSFLGILIEGWKSRINNQENNNKILVPHSNFERCFSSFSVHVCDVVFRFHSALIAPVVSLKILFFLSLKQVLKATITLCALSASKPCKFERSRQTFLIRIISARVPLCIQAARLFVNEIWFVTILTVARSCIVAHVLPLPLFITISSFFRELKFQCFQIHAFVESISNDRNIFWVFAFPIYQTHLKSFFSTYFFLHFHLISILFFFLSLDSNILNESMVWLCCFNNVPLSRGHVNRDNIKHSKPPTSKKKKKNRGQFWCVCVSAGPSWQISNSQSECQMVRTCETQLNSKQSFSVSQQHHRHRHTHAFHCP